MCKLHIMVEFTPNIYINDIHIRFWSSNCLLLLNISGDNSRPLHNGFSTICQSLICHIVPRGRDGVVLDCQGGVISNKISCHSRGYMYKWLCFQSMMTSFKWKQFPRYWPSVRGIHRWIPAQTPVTRSFDVFFDLRLNKRLRKQSWGWWFETQSRPLWSHCNGIGPHGSIRRQMPVPRDIKHG